MLNPSKLYFKCINLSYAVGDKVLFKELSFEMSGPGIIQIEGSNGVGKSTLLKLLAGFIKSNEPSIQLPGSGRPVHPGDLTVGEFSFFTTTSLGLLSDLTGREHIEMISKALKIESSLIEHEIKVFMEIEIFKEVLDKKVEDFSQGMKQLLRLFLHLFFNPKVLFLDEPFLFLSPMVREVCLKKIHSLAAVSLVFITDQQFLWMPKCNYKKITLGEK
jgi:ABC-type multidrug transport system ATPase subunit